MALHHRIIGNAIQLYNRVRRPRTLGVRGVVIDGDDRVALVRHTIGQYWYLPGGGVKKWESFEAALVRELREEVALNEVTVDRVLGVYHSVREHKDDHVVVFVAHVPAGMPLTRGDPLEISEAAWFPLDTLPEELSPASARRIAEYRTGEVIHGAW